MTPSESALTLDHVRRCTEHRGLTLPLASALAQLSVPQLQEKRIALRALHGQLELAVRELGDPALPLQCSQYPLDQQRSAILFVCMSMPDVARGLDALVHYCSAVTDDLQWSMEWTSDSLVLAADAPGPCYGDRLAHEYHLAEIVTNARLVTRGEWSPREVRFAHAPMLPISVYEEVMRAPLRFGHHRVEIVIDRESLAAPITERTPLHLVPYFRTWADVLLARRAPSFLERVQDAIEGELDGGDPSLPRVAQRLATSERSLHRHLASHGASFRELIDRARAARAVELLEEDRSLAAIAGSLGFSDARAFARAFKRWTGRTPVQHRAASK